MYPSNTPCRLATTPPSPAMWPTLVSLLLSSLDRSPIPYYFLLALATIPHHVCWRRAGYSQAIIESLLHVKTLPSFLGNCCPLQLPHYYSVYPQPLLLLLFLLLCISLMGNIQRVRGSRDYQP